MQPHEERVVEEEARVAEFSAWATGNLGRLRKFLTSSRFASLSVTEQENLSTQAEQMSAALVAIEEYRGTLALRIEGFKEAAP
jgi:hypothetical protein